MAMKLGLADYQELGFKDEGVFEDKEEFSGNKEHSKLIKSLQKALPNTTNARKTIRREAATEVAEFSAVKQRSKGNLNSLLKSVKETGEDKALDKVNKLVKAPVKQQIKTLETPLEKPVALKTKRTVLYDSAKKDVSRWNALVYHNRLADQLVYPLNAGKKLSKKTGRDVAADFIPMTPLEEEMAKVLYGEEYLKERKAALEKPKGPTDAEAYALSVEEALAMHSEMARMRALQCYEMSKAKRQNKIKSKKYHRLLRKEKIKKQLKEFEELQQTDPEQAIAKLTELEESRVQERMSLKHRNTTKWAKMQSARAKYDKDSRVALSEQLKISRDLTQKVQVSSDEEEDLDMELPQLIKPSINNPWMLNPEVQGNAKLELYYSGYKKLWEDINSKKELERKKLADLNKDAMNPLCSDKVDAAVIEKCKDDVTAALVSQPLNSKTSIKKGKNKKKTKQKPSKSNPSSEDEDFTEHDLEGLFEKAEDKIRSQASKKLQQLEKADKIAKRVVRNQKRSKERVKKKKTAKQRQGDIDEIQDLDVNEEEQNMEVENVEKVGLLTIRSQSTPSSLATQVQDKSKLEIIDPDNYLKVSMGSKAKKGKFAGKGFKDLELEEEEDDDQGMIIADAFEDDDVVEEFKKQKNDEINASKPQDIDLHLPGWGEWGGKGIVPNAKRRKRFIIKAPPQAPRKDARLSHVILNEEAGEKMKDHQVRNLPFPFKRVKDFEKTIRAPIGRTWLPEKSMKDLIAPKVITRLGSIIEPLDEDNLVKNIEERSKTFKAPL